MKCLRNRWLGGSVLYFALACGNMHCGALQSSTARPAFEDADSRPVCLVLSVGGPAGLAHLGAIQALQHSELEVRYVVGNSMGALVGGLYASEPASEVVERYLSFASAYLEQTKRSAEGRGVLGFLFGAALTLATGGAALPALAAGGGGAVIGAEGTEKQSLERTVAVYDEAVAGVTIEALPIRFVTFHHAMTTTGVRLNTVQRGRLATAVGKSIANPLMFPQFEPTKAGYVDPGTDRVSATPVQDACSQFPDSRLLVVNVSGQPSFYQADIPCPVLEINLDAGEVPPEAMLGQGATFAKVVDLGARQMQAALKSRGIGVTSKR